MRKLSRIRSPRVGSVKMLSSFKMMTHWLLLLSWCLGEDRNLLMRWGCSIERLIKTNGKKFTVLYLKECLRIVHHFIAGTLVHLSEGIPVDLTGGLPRMIPGPLRSKLRLKDPKSIRVVLTVLSVFRVIDIKGQLKLSTITDPFKGQSQSFPQWEIADVMKSLNTSFHLKRVELGRIKLVFSGAAGPNHRSSMQGIFRDISAWLLPENIPLFHELQKFLTMQNGGKEFYDLIFNEFTESWLISNFDDKLMCIPSLRYEEKRKPYLGRLSLKQEPAGKIRIFAITDVITQSAMKPLHDAIFSILKDIPMDGTFNQSRPLERLISLYKEGEIKGFYSYDLSAATDRLPALLQKDILSSIIGESFAESWYNVMTQREWTLVCDASTKMYISEDTTVNYSVGQAMGALSSWAMLALTHHFIVRLAAIRVGKPTFDNYALLGDDIVIADQSVAESYHHIMVDTLGVDINLSKSMVSPNSFEFAKRIITNGEDVSGIGPKNLLVAIRAKGGITSVLLDLVNKGYYLDEEIINGMFSKKVPTLSNKIKSDVLWTILGPFGFVPANSGRLSSNNLMINDALLSVRLDSLISSIDQALHEHDVREWGSRLIDSGTVLTKTALWDPYTGYILEEEGRTFIRNIKFHILDLLSQSRDEIEFGTPVRRFFFNEPLIHFGRTNDRLQQIVEYIYGKFEVDNLVPPIFDPFKEDEVVLPFSGLKSGLNFFNRVRAIEVEKDAVRNG